MLHLIERHLYASGWDKVTYQDLLENRPLGKLVTYGIALAVMENATRINYGLPPGMELSKENEAWILARHKELQREDESIDEELGERRGSVRFHRRDGLPEQPCWHEIGGKWYCQMGMPVWLYPYLPQLLCERLVSLGGEPLEGGKEEWIGYTCNRDEGDRKFVRVDLVLETNNSLTIELLETRALPKNATVWWRHWKV